jgi:hypothetical protein
MTTPRPNRRFILGALAGVSAGATAYAARQLRGHPITLPPPDTTPTDFSASWPAITGAVPGGQQTGPTVTPVGYDTTTSFLCLTAGFTVTKSGAAAVLAGTAVWVTSGTLSPGETLTPRAAASVLASDTTINVLSMDGGNLVVSWSISTMASGNSVVASRNGTLALAPFLTSLPNGNDVQLVSVSGSGKLNIGSYPIYKDGDVLLGPGASWNGTIESGYTSWTEDATARSAPPVLEARSTARPTLRIETGYHQRFASDLTFVVIARAPGGIAKVRFYCEGAYVDVSTSKNYQYVDNNGKTRVIRDAYCVTLDHSAFLAQHASGNAINIFVRAYANDGTMQTNMLGSTVSAAGINLQNLVRFFPEPTTHDKVVWIDTTQATTQTGLPAGVDARFNNIDDAFLWLGNKPATGVTLLGAQKSGRIIVKNTHNWVPLVLNDWNAASGFNLGTSWHDIECDPGVRLTIGHTTVSGSGTSWNSAISGVRFRRGVYFDQTFDRAVVSLLVGTNARATGKMLGFWYDGCEVGAQVNLNAAIPLGGDRNIPEGAMFYGYSGPFFVTDCKIAHRSCTSTQICHNNEFLNYWVDQWSANLSLVGNLVDGLDESFWDGNSPAFTVAYSGPKQNARIERRGYNTTSGTRTLALESKDNADASWTTDVLLDVSVNWRSSLAAAYVNTNGAASGWSATQDCVQDSTDDRNLIVLSVESWVGDFYDKTVNTPPGADQACYLKENGALVVPVVHPNTFKGSVAGQLPLWTFRDIHADVYQHQSGVQGVLMEYNITENTFGAQPMNLATSSGSVEDYWVCNNSWDTNGVFLILSKAHTYSNFTLAHNNHKAWLELRPPTTYDAYCTVANNMVELFGPNTPGSVGALSILNNHCSGTGSGSQALSGVTTTGTVSGTVVGPAVTSMIPGMSDGDLEPDKALNDSVLAAPFAAANVDIAGFSRTAPAPCGPKGYRATSGSWVYAQAQNLQINAVNATPGTGVNVFHLRWKDGPGNTGSDVDLTITVDVAA